MKKTGVLLSGCGFLDGSEIHEAVLTLLALDKAGVEAVCLAPDIMQHDVVNHYTGKEMKNESRNVLVESARIARGSITDVKDIDTLALDALILPGGYGAAKNLSNYAFKAAECDVNIDVARAVQSFYKAGKPLGFICIAPAIAARVLGKEHIELTIGNDAETSSHIESMGARHIECPVWNTVISNKGNIVSTPAYMLGPTIKEVAKGIEKLVADIVNLL
ncbi:MAG: isoprenoid biosynthesis glyoxalase ElbB [Chlorobiaceae bacterium]